MLVYSDSFVSLLCNLAGRVLRPRYETWNNVNCPSSVLRFEDEHTMALAGNIWETSSRAAYHVVKVAGTALCV